MLKNQLLMSLHQKPLLLIRLRQKPLLLVRLRQIRLRQIRLHQMRQLMMEMSQTRLIPIPAVMMRVASSATMQACAETIRERKLSRVAVEVMAW